MEITDPERGLLAANRKLAGIEASGRGNYGEGDPGRGVGAELKGVVPVGYDREIL